MQRRPWLIGGIFREPQDTCTIFLRAIGGVLFVLSGIGTVLTNGTGIYLL